MKKLVRFSLENFDTIVAIAVSLFAAVFGIFGGNQIALLAGIATTLGLLAYGIIRDRAARDVLGSNIQRLETTIKSISTGKISADLFFINRAKAVPLPEFLRSGQESLDIMGTSLVSIGTIYSAILRELKEKGGKVRIIVSNPDNLILQEFLAMRYLETENAAILESQVRTALSGLLPLIGRSQRGGSVDVKVVDFIPPFSYVGMDTKKRTGKIQIEYVLHRAGLGRNPIFFLDSADDVYWFGEFQEQFELLWKNAVKYEKPSNKG